MSFALILLFGPWMGKAGRGAGFVATAAIVTAFVLSAAALTIWLSASSDRTAAEHGSAEPNAANRRRPCLGAIAPTRRRSRDHKLPISPVSGDWYALGVFGSLRVTIGYYIDALTIAMFFMVTMVASCIHIYSFGYMHEELSEVTDHQVTLADGHHLRRRGRFHRFYQYLSLFCFSMLGLVIAGNIAMVFVFWELVGICSYFLIGFYIERKSASNAANKAFIVNRVGDFGMIIGLMAVWAGMGTFSFGDYKVKDAQGRESDAPGIFSQVRPAENNYQLQAPDGMVKFAKRDEIAKIAAIEPNRELAEATIAMQYRRLAEGRFRLRLADRRRAWEFSAAAWARAPNSRCTSGCPTRWKAPRPSARSFMRPRWSRPACIWSGGSIRSSRRKC